MVTTSGWYVISQSKNPISDNPKLNVHSKPHRTEAEAKQYLHSIRHKVTAKREYYTAQINT